jgi:hypothetical protein
VSFAAALKEWQAQAIGACDDFDQEAALAEPAGCERIDVLFVIDGSGSMTEEQAALAGGGGEPAVFAEFTDALAAELTSVEDFHVGVVSTELGSTRLHTHRYEPKEAPTPENAVRARGADAVDRGADAGAGGVVRVPGGDALGGG